MGRETFGTRFKHARSLSGFTQNEAATAIAVHSQTISEWERDVLVRLPPAEILRKASVALGVHFMWLAFGEGKPPRRSDVRAS